jgi:hypothetical protein
MSGAEKYLWFGLFMGWTMLIYTMAISTGKARGAAEVYRRLTEEMDSALPPSPEPPADSGREG